MWEYGSRVTFLRVVGTELQKYVTHDSRLSPPLLVRLSWVTLPHFHCLRYLVSVLMSEASTSPNIQLDLHCADEGFMGGFCRRLKLPRRIIFVNPQNLSIFFQAKRDLSFELGFSWNFFLPGISKTKAKFERNSVWMYKRLNYVCAEISQFTYASRLKHFIVTHFLKLA